MAKKQRALRADFGLQLDDLLQRPPTAREVDFLGERRSGYAEVVARDVKTLARWSDAAIQDLRARLIDDTFTGNLYVVAAVDGDRIAGISMIREELGQDGVTIARSSTEIENHEDGPSVPALIYALPRDWRPVSLTMAVVFRSEPMPVAVWASTSSSLVTVAFAGDRHVLNVQPDGTAACRFVRPRLSAVYCLQWDTRPM